MIFGTDIHGPQRMNPYSMPQRVTNIAGNNLCHLSYWFCTQSLSQIITKQKYAVNFYSKIKMSKEDRSDKKKTCPCGQTI